MKTHLMVLAGVLALTASLHADTSYIMNFGAEPTGQLTDPSGGWAISPYSATIGGVAATLYCDDFNDNINWGQTNISVYQTALTAASGTLSADTRYGAANPTNNAVTATVYTTGVYPTGVTLYDEMAWLATQMQHTSGVDSTANNIALQEAIWDLTNNTGYNEGAAPNSSGTNTGANTTGDHPTGTGAAGAQSAATWIADAKAYIAGLKADGTSTWANGNDYSSLIVSNWSIVTAVASAGCTEGSTGTTGCTSANRIGTTAGVTQEFLDFTGSLNTGGGGSSAVPEPASFVLIGSGLMAGGLFSRRRMNARSKS